MWLGLRMEALVTKPTYGVVMQEVAAVTWVTERSIVVIVAAIYQALTVSSLVLSMIL